MSSQHPSIATVVWKLEKSILETDVRLGTDGIDLSKSLEAIDIVFPEAEQMRERAPDGPKRAKVDKKQLQLPHSEYRAVCKLETKHASGITGQCTGFLIDNNTIVTAAHCVYDNDIGPALVIHAFVGRHGKESGCEARTGRAVSIPLSWLENEDHLHDIALIELAEPFETVLHPFRWLQTPLSGDKRDLSTVGYPADLPAKPSSEDEKGQSMYAVKSSHTWVLTARGLEHHLKVFYGNSGGPILMWDHPNREWKAIAVLATFDTAAPIERAGNSLHALGLSIGRLVGRNAIGAGVELELWSGWMGWKFDVPVSAVPSPF